MSDASKSENTDLWGSAFPDSPVESAPVLLLRQQADVLTSKTQGRVEGVVMKSFRNGTAWASLYARVPSLEGYVYKMLSVAHPASADPASPISLTVHDTFRGGEDWQPINSMADFVTWLREALSSEQAHAVIENLLNYIPDHATTSRGFSTSSSASRSHE